MAEVARKVMGDAPIAYVEGVGGVRVAEDSIVAVKQNDVRSVHSRVLVVPADMACLHRFFHSK